MVRLRVVRGQACENGALTVPLDDIKLAAMPPGLLAVFFEKHGFTSLLRRLGAGSGSPARSNQLEPPKQTRLAPAPVPSGTHQTLPEMPAVDLAAYECVQTLEALDPWIAREQAARLGAVNGGQRQAFQVDGHVTADE